MSETCIVKDMIQVRWTIFRILNQLNLTIILFSRGLGINMTHILNKIIEDREVMLTTVYLMEQNLITLIKEIVLIIQSVSKVIRLWQKVK